MKVIISVQAMIKENKLPFVFKDGIKARFGIHPRYSLNSKDTIWFELPSQFIFHVMNSYDIEDKNQVIMYACRYDKVILSIQQK